MRDADAIPAVPAPAKAPPPAGGKPRKRLLRNYVLEPRLQLQYIIAVTLVSAVVAVVLGYFIWYQRDFATRTIIDGVNRTDWIDAGLKTEIARTLRQTDTDIIKKMGLVFAGMFAILTLFLIMMTHKVAGPLYKIGQAFDRMRDGRLSPIGEVRHGDYLTSFYLKFKDMHDALRARAASEAEVYDRFLASCESAGVDPGGDLDKQLAALKTLRDERKDSLKE